MQPPSGRRVGQDGDREAARRHHLERGELAVGGAAVTDERLVADPPQQPADPDLVGDRRALQPGRRLLHPAPGLEAEDPLPVFSALAEMEAGVPDLVGRRRRQCAGRRRRTRESPGPRQAWAFVAVQMADGEATGHHLGREEEAAGEAERLEHQLAGGGLVGLPGHLLDDAPGQRDRGVVVRGDRTQRMDLAQLRHRFHVPRQRVVAVSGVEKEVAFPTGGVVQQVQDRHPARDRLVLEPELRDIGAHRCLQGDLAALHQAHDHRGGEGLGRGADLEQRPGIHREWILEAGDTGEGVPLLTLVVDADRDARHAQAQRQLLELFLQRAGIDGHAQRPPPWPRSRRMLRGTR